MQNRYKTKYRYNSYDFIYYISLLSQKNWKNTDSDSLMPVIKQIYNSQ